MAIKPSQIRRAIQRLPLKERVKVSKIIKKMPKDTSYQHIKRALKAKGVTKSTRQKILKGIQLTGTPVTVERKPEAAPEKITKEKATALETKIKIGEKVAREVAGRYTEKRPTRIIAGKIFKEGVVGQARKEKITSPKLKKEIEYEEQLRRKEEERLRRKEKAKLLEFQKLQKAEMEMLQKLEKKEKKQEDYLKNLMKKVFK